MSLLNVVPNDIIKVLHEDVVMNDKKSPRTAYSIGEAARIMGISPQLLRFYCDNGLFAPEYIDPDSGYRYFTYQQLSYIDRIRFWRHCGISLKDIKSILTQNDIGLLFNSLKVQRQKKIKEMEEIVSSVKAIEIYLNFLMESSYRKKSMEFYIKHFEKRYILVNKCCDDYSPEKFYEQFKKVESKYNNIELARPVTVIIDLEALLHNSVKRYYVGRLLLGTPIIVDDHIKELPAGQYYCTYSDIHRPGWDSKCLPSMPQATSFSKYVVALECESDFSQYNNEVHELQFFNGNNFIL